LTTYWDVKYHVGPCFSQKYLNPIKLNYTFQFDPQLKWGSSGANESNPFLNIDYEDYFYLVIEPYSKSQDNTTINNLLNTTASIELAMYYLDLYEYESPPVVMEEKSTSQAVTIFWGIVAIVAIYLVAGFLIRRKKRISSFLAGLVMPDVEFKYRQYKID
jgi:hypothetical protein